MIQLFVVFAVYIKYIKAVLSLTQKEEPQAEHFDCGNILPLIKLEMV